MKELIKSTLSNIYTVLCIVVVVPGIISIAAVVAGIRPFVMISESMHPEVTKGSLVLLNTKAGMEEVRPGDNVAYVLGKVEAMHKVVSTSPVSTTSTISTSSGESLSAGMVDNMTTETVENGETGSTEAGGIVVRSLADQGETLVSADMYIGKEVLSIPAVGGWIRGVLEYKWVVIGLAVVLIVVGCIPMRKAEVTATHLKVQEQS